MRVNPLAGIGRTGVAAALDAGGGAGLTCTFMRATITQLAGIDPKHANVRTKSGVLLLSALFALEMQAEPAASESAQCFTITPIGASIGSSRHFMVKNDCRKVVSGLAYEISVLRKDGTRPKHAVVVNFAEWVSGRLPNEEEGLIAANYIPGFSRTVTLTHSAGADTDEFVPNTVEVAVLAVASP